LNLEIQLNGEAELWWNGGEVDLWGATDLRDGKEHTVGFTRTRQKIELIVDGVVEGEGEGGEDVGVPADGFSVGRDWQLEGSGEFKGEILKLEIPRMSRERQWQKQDLLIAKLRAEADGNRGAEREEGDWGLQSDWEAEDAAIAAQREAEDAFLQAERDEEDLTWEAVATLEAELPDAAAAAVEEREKTMKLKAPKMSREEKMQPKALHQRLALLEQELAARKQRRMDQTAQLRELEGQITKRDARAAMAKKSEGAVLAQSSSSDQNQADRLSKLAMPSKRDVVKRPSPPPSRRPESRFDGPVVTLGTSTRSGVGSVHSDKPNAKIAAKNAAAAAAAAKIRQDAATTRHHSAASSQFRVFRSRELDPKGFLLVPPELAEAHKPAIVQSLALATSGTWCSCEVAGGQRMYNVANKFGEKAWKRVSAATDYSIARAVFAAVAETVPTQAIEAAQEAAGLPDTSTVARR
jgi:hypothetical protein